MSDIENFDCDIDQNGIGDSDVVEEFELHLGKSFKIPSTNSHYKIIYEGQENIDLTKATELEIDEDNETIQISISSEMDEDYTLNGRRFDNHLGELDEDDDDERQCVVVFDEITRVHVDLNGVGSPEFGDWEQKFEELIEVAEHSGEGDFEDEMEEEEDYPENHIYEENGYEENGHYEENGVEDDYYEQVLLSDEFEEVDEPVVQSTSTNNQMNGEIIEDEITKRDGRDERDERDGSESSGLSSSDSSTSSATGSDNESGEDDASDSDSALESTLGELESQLNKEMGKDRKTNAEGKSSTGPTSLAALFGGEGSKQEEHEDSGSSSGSD
ncbi:6483_t:CDS:2 [Diversispora eburnea]|uniref:6483_t:CDS:1 n=1 Tax=Diversispora eburnea TaxID=1213867 RepID=A0A9N8V6D1_9GLOM|nr:6483_t:CDS:2 [Diversispora eburnea]